jgi:hypothetical protein
MDGISLLTQFNSHGVFIALEGVGYILLAVSFMCIVPVFSKENLLERWLRWLLAGGFSLLVLSFIYCSMRYGLKREYRFEVAAISIDWLVLIAAGIMIAVVFHRGARR